MSTPQTEHVKAWLRRYKQQSDELGFLFDELEELQEQATAAGVSKLDGMPHAPTRTADRAGMILVRIERLQETIADRQAAAEATEREIRGAISRITGSRYAEQRAVLRFRYLHGMGWSDVNFKLHGARGDYLEKEDSYLNRTMKIHNRALTALTVILPGVAEGGKTEDDDED